VGRGAFVNFFAKKTFIRGQSVLVPGRFPGCSMRGSGEATKFTGGIDARFCGRLRFVFWWSVGFLGPSKTKQKKKTHRFFFAGFGFSSVLFSVEQIFLWLGSPHKQKKRKGGMVFFPCFLGGGGDGNRFPQKKKL